MTLLPPADPARLLLSAERAGPPGRGDRTPRLFAGPARLAPLAVQAPDGPAAIPAERTA